MSTTQNLSQNKEVYQQRVRAELDKLNAQINEMKAKADQSKADAKIHYTNIVEDLQTKRAAVEQKLDEMQSASEGAWQEIQVGVENAWNDLQSAFSGAVAKFNNSDNRS